MPVILYPSSFISFCFFMYCMLSLCVKLLVHEDDSDYIKCTFIIIVVSDAVSISEKSFQHQSILIRTMKVTKVDRSMLKNRI